MGDRGGGGRGYRGRDRRGGGGGYRDRGYDRRDRRDRYDDRRDDKEDRYEERKPRRRYRDDRDDRRGGGYGGGGRGRGRQRQRRRGYSPSKNSRTLLGKGFPYDVDKDDVREFFKPKYDRDVEYVYFINDRSGRFTGDCYIIFDNDKAARGAQKEKHK